MTLSRKSAGSTSEGIERLKSMKLASDTGRSREVRSCTVAESDSSSSELDLTEADSELGLYNEKREGALSLSNENGLLSGENGLL